MAFHRPPGFPEHIYIYLGGRAPFVRIPIAVIHPDLKTVNAYAFERNNSVRDVHFHDDVETVETHAFCLCGNIKKLSMKGVRNVDYSAFYACWDLSSVEFGTLLETVGESAFDQCNSLETVKMPVVRSIGERAFQDTAISEFDIPLGCEVVEDCAFCGCESLTKLSMPLKANMIQARAFIGCPKLVHIDLIGGVHDFVSSLHLKEWENEAKAEINRINEVLPLSGERTDRTTPIMEWIQSVHARMVRYKREHYAVLKEAMTILELALWRVRLIDAEKDRRDNDNDPPTTTSSASLDENLSQKNQENIF